MPTMPDPLPPISPPDIPAMVDELAAKTEKIKAMAVENAQLKATAAANADAAEKFRAALDSLAAVLA